jgi:hypothetical protein
MLQCQKCMCLMLQILLHQSPQITKHIICIHVSRAKKIANAAAGGFGKPVGVLTAEAVDFTQIQNMGGLSRSGRVLTEQSRKGGRNNESIICVNPVSTIQFLFWS